MSQPTAILFVCLGNICRSPMAESILQQKLIDRGLTDRFLVESAGTADYHEGEWPDPRTLKVLEENKVTYKSRARKIKLEDFERFDHIIAMDHDNVRNLLDLPASVAKRVTLCQSWNAAAIRSEVPDPYYGELNDFRMVYKMLDAATDSILDALQKSPNDSGKSDV